jgi:hypothetical protein
LDVRRAAQRGDGNSNPHRLTDSNEFRIITGRSGCASIDCCNLGEVAMRADELLELVRKRPFVPLRICVTDGKSYEIRHPDQIIVLRGRIDIGVGSDRETGAAERVEHVSLLHVVRVEELASSSA